MEQNEVSLQVNGDMPLHVKNSKNDQKSDITKQHVDMWARAAA